MRRALIALVVLLASRAFADEDAPARPFVMPSLSGGSSAGVDLSYTSFKFDFGIFGRYDARAIIVEPVIDVRLAKGLVGFARFPIGFGSVDVPAPAQGCCDASLGNLTFGGRFVAPIRGVKGSDFAAELSFSAPTASDPSSGSNDNSGTGEDIVAFAGATHDLAYYQRRLTALRMNVYARHVAQQFFVQAMLGFHLYFIDNTAPTDDETQSNLRLSAAAGFLPTQRVAVIAEITNNFNASAKNGQEAWIHALDLGLRYENHDATFGAHIFIPLDDAFTNVDMLGVGVDVRAKF